MKKLSKSNNGFTLVELLAVITIIGILMAVAIFAVSRFLDNARADQKKSQEKTLVMAAQNYLQENRGLLPKSIGETSNVSVNVLKENNYITETIKNYNKQSCMENSYVSIYKESATKYVYKAHLYCGNEEPTISIAKSTPDITIKFMDSLGNVYDKSKPEMLQNVSDAKFVITFSGGKRSDGTKIALEGYSYSILTKVAGDNELKEVYSSGTLNGNGNTDIYIDRDNNLSDFIDITGETTVAIRATARNRDGGINDTVKFLGEDEKQAEVIYHDNAVPQCVEGQTSGEATGQDDWINISTPKGERTITVTCKDEGGSGCIRSTFTKTWNGNEAYEYDTIQIKDNANNYNECRVRVNIDKAYPIINIDGYARGRVETQSTGNSILMGTKTSANSNNGTVIINANEYANLVNGYMNKAKYPYGVIYKINLSDTVGLKKWTWQVNKPDVDSTSDAEYEIVNSESDEAKSETISGTGKDISVYLFYNGLRKGVLTVEDKAGNKASYTIYANIDRKAPDPPEIINSTTGTSEGDWTRTGVSLNLKVGKSLSPIADYYYTFSEDTTEFGVDDSEADSKWIKIEGGTGLTTFDTDPWTDEMNKKIYIMVCDIVGNCSDSSSTRIMIDKTAPTGIKLKGYKKISSDDVTTASDLDTLENNTWHKGWALVIPSGAKDNNGSGGIYYKVTVTGASENVVDSVQNYRNVDAEGTSIVSFKACDKLGNCSGASSFTVKLDRTGPTLPSITNSSYGNWTKDNVTLTIGSYDSSSKLGKFYYSYNASASSNGDDPKTQWVLMPEGNNNNDTFEKTWSDDINERVYIKACDKVGNCSSINNTYIRIDNTPPKKPDITNPTDEEWTNTNFSLTLESNDGTGSGLNDYQYTYNSSATEVGDDADTQWKSSGLVATEEFTTNPFSIERDQYVYWRVCDTLDNCSSSSKTKIRIDKTKPTCGETTVTSVDTTTGVSGTIGCSDEDSHCVRDTYNYGPLKVTGNVSIKDNAGNSRSCSISISTYDCSTYGDWQFFSLYLTFNNNCPVDEEGWDYDFGNCSDNYNPNDVCSAKCNASANPTYYVCCTKRRRTPKICFSSE
jgi:prepilin-type N-terminal cleavage/methylation domain-containing protein